MKPLLHALVCAGVLALPASALAQPHADARPQVTAQQAQQLQVADYLRVGSEVWMPPPVDAREFKPDLIVAADGSGTHASVQAAVDALPAASPDAPRRFILVRPGTHRAPVCARGKTPFTLYGLPQHTADTVLVASHYAGEAKRPGIDAANACEPALQADRYGTSGSASVALYGDDIVVAHLTIANDATEQLRARGAAPPGESVAGAQAVALMLRGDRILLHDVRLLGHQDTLYVRAAAPDGPARMLVRNSLIAGDVDFVFGNATLVIEDSTLLSRMGRTPGSRGHVLAPSTLPAQPHGFLVTRSRLLAEPGVPAGAVSLGRAWDQGVPPGQWRSGVSPNGQALIRESLLGPHLAGWAASTSQRPFAAEGEDANRFAEYRNTATDLTLRLTP